MPLYVHRTGEQVRTVPGGAEDLRLAADPAWRLDGTPAAEDDTDDAAHGDEETDTP